MTTTGRWKPTGGAAAPEPAYADLLTWFSECLSPLIRRRMGGGRGWCEEWWRHPEAVVRLTATWRCWEEARQEGGSAISRWFLHVLDPHMAVLMDVERGPFQSCGHGHSDKLAALPHTDPGPAWRGTWAAFMAETEAEQLTDYDDEEDANDLGRE